MGSITTFLAPVPKVATVNGEDITTQEMQVELERNRRVMLSRNRDPNSIDEDVLRQTVLQTLIRRKLLTQAADEMGLQFSNTSLDADILATPVFQVDGVYDPNQFQLVIGSAGYSPVTYRNEIRRDKLFTQLDTGIRGSSFLPTKQSRERVVSLSKLAISLI